MSAATIGKHAREPRGTRRGGEQRRWRDRLRRRSVAVPSEPEAGHLCPQAPSDAEIMELITGMRPLSSQPAFAGVSLAEAMLPAREPGASLGGYVPRPAGRGAWAAPTRELLGEVLDGLRDMDGLPPVAFVRRDGDPERLSGLPVYLGTAPAAAGHVARIGLGFGRAGRPVEYAANRAVLDQAILVLMQARDDLVYASSGTGAAPAADAPASPEPPAAEPPAPGPPAAGPETAGDAAEVTAREPAPVHGELVSRATGVLGRAAFLPEPEDPAAADEISSTIAILTQALNLYRSVSDSTVEPFWVYSDLPAGEDASKTAALERLSADIADAQEALIEVTRRYRDDETAALVAGQAGA